MPNDKMGYSLGELIKTAAKELKEARAESDKDGVMQFEKCELELAVTFEKGAGGGIRVWLLNADAKVKSETVSKIKLSFGAIPGKTNAYQAGDASEKGRPFKKQG